MKKGFYIAMAAVVILIVVLMSYGVYLNERSANQITLRMNERSLPLHGMKVATRSIYPMFKLDFINFYSNEMVDVTALIDGKVNRLFVEQNNFVREGDPIVELFNEEIPLQIIQAESDILAEEAALNRAENTYNRYLQLVELDAISRQKFDEAKSELESAKARLKNYKARRDQLSIRQTRQIVTAPIGGEILKFYKQVGAYVVAGNPIVLIGNFDTLYFNTSFAGNFERLEVGQVVEVKFPNEENFSKTYGAQYSPGNRGINQIFTAKLAEISPSMNQKAELRKFIWQLDNSVGLLEPGFYEGADIYSKTAKKCLTIPINSITGDADDFVYTVENGVLKMRKIVTGANDGKFIEVISGLSEGDIVITSSTEGLSDGLKVEITLDEEAN